MARSQTIAVLEPELAGPLRAVGATVVEARAPGPEADLVAMGPDWDRLRTWRLGGHTHPALVWLRSGAAPQERALLEPLVTVRRLDPPSLEAALQALAKAPAAGRIAVGDAELDVATRRWRRGDQQVVLAQREVDLLAYLAARAGRVVSRDELLLQVWGHAVAVSHKSVDMAVVRLRRKIEADPSAPQLLLACYGGGYKLAIPATVPRDAPVDAGRTAAEADLVGRDEVIGELTSRLAAGARWIAVTGPAGIGKTRVARAVAARRERHGIHAVWAPLASAGTASEASVAIAAAAGVAVGQGSSLGAALAALGRTLVVLDTVEHLPELAASAEAWLAEAPELQILATTQAPGPGIRFDLDPLPPDDAIALFVARAARVGGALPDDPGADPDVHELVGRLAGSPLAIELSAARTRVHRVPELVRLLDQPLRLLRGATADDPRHRSLEAALDWTWAHLPAALRDALAAAAAFRGPAPLPALASVLGVDEVDAGTLVEALLDRALCSVTAEGVGLLDAVRALGRREGLGAGPERATLVRDRHAAWILEATRAALAEREGPTPRPALDRLVAWLPELAAAAEHLARADRTAVGWLALGQDVVLRSYGTAAERRALLDRALDPPPPDGAVEARLRLARALARPEAAPADVQAEYERAAALFVAAGEPVRAGEALARLAHVHRQRDLRTAAEVAARAVEVSGGAPLPTATLVHCRARLQPAGEGGDDPVPRLFEALSALELAGQPSLACAVATISLDAARVRCDWAAGARLVERLLALARQVDDPGTVAVAESMAADVALDRGAFAQAVAQLERALPVLHRTGRLDAVNRAYEGLIVAHVASAAYDAAEDAIARLLALQQAKGNRRGRCYTLMKRAVMLIDRGRTAQARAVRAEIEALGGATDPVLSLSLVAFDALVPLADGDLDAAVRAVAALPEPAPPSSRLRSATIRAVCAARRGLPTAALVDEAEAVLTERWPRREDWVALLDALRGRPAAAAERVAGRVACDGVVRILARALIR